ncbi:hypothetical protein [Mesorhizobium sp. M0046]|uniref:hypothetical protein n=1 Tax=Mesorhizobium sp. M0046 TaxID=2956858 RepID=UPI00333788D8
MSDPVPDEVDEQLWDEACRRADMIREFLKRRTSRSTIDNVAGLAAQLEVSQATTYRLINLFNAGGNVMSLVDRKPGRPEGHRARPLPCPSRPRSAVTPTRESAQSGLWPKIRRRVRSTACARVSSWVGVRMSI